MHRWTAALVGLIALTSLTAPGAVAEPEAVALPAEEKCAPPCGYIWPTIGLEPDTAFPYLTSELTEFPSEIKVKVTYYWDMEQDGTGAPGDTEDMSITLALTKKPDWMTAKVEPAVCTFTLIPITSEYEVCEVTITNEITEYPMTENALEEFGKRLMLFATSKESGTFKASYGVEDMRFDWDGAPNVAETDGIYSSTDNAETKRAVPAGFLVPLALLGAAAIVVRRRR